MKVAAVLKKVQVPPGVEFGIVCFAHDATSICEGAAFGKVKIKVQLLRVIFALLKFDVFNEPWVNIP